MTTEIYSNDDLLLAKTRKRKTWTFFFTTTAVFIVGLTAGLLAFFRQSPDAPMRIPLLVADCVLTVIYAAFAVLYFIVNVSAAKKYMIFMEGALSAEPEKISVIFERIGEETNLLGGVEVRPLYAQEWSDELEDYKDVVFYLDEFKPLPPFKCGDAIDVALHKGVIVSYELTGIAAEETSAPEESAGFDDETIKDGSNE